MSVAIGLKSQPCLHRLYRLDQSISSLRTAIYSLRIAPRLSKIYIIAGKIVRQVQSSKIEDPSKDDQMSRTVHVLDQELVEWAENLPQNVKQATSDKKNPKMLALCLTAFFMYYSAIINLRRWIPLFPFRIVFCFRPRLF